MNCSHHNRGIVLKKVERNYRIVPFIAEFVQSRELEDQLPVQRNMYIKPFSVDIVDSSIFFFVLKNISKLCGKS